MLYELHPDGTSSSVTTTGTAIPNASWNNAGIDRNGIMYLMQPGTYTLFKIDLKTKNITTVTCTGIPDASSSAVYGDIISDP